MEPSIMQQHTRGVTEHIADGSDHEHLLIVDSLADEWCDEAPQHKGTVGCKESKLSEIGYPQLLKELRGYGYEGG